MLTVTGGSQVVQSRFLRSGVLAVLHTSLHLTVAYVCIDQLLPFLLLPAHHFPPTSSSPCGLMLSPGPVPEVMRGIPSYGLAVLWQVG